MEKIYMEGNKNKSKKKSVIDGTVVLSFAVAIFAIVSLVAFGINQISYAAPSSPTGDSFTFYLGPRVLAGGGSVPLYFSDENLTNPIFCIEHKAAVNRNNPTYTMEKENGAPKQISDNGLLYILNKGYNMSITATGSGSINNENYARAWIMQTAIWLYLNDTSNKDIDKLTDDEINAIKTASSYDYDDGSPLGQNIAENINLYNAYVKGLVDNAKQIGSNIISVVANGTEFTKGEDFYQSPEISVVVENDLVSDFNGYSISLNGIEGAYVVDANGNNIDTSNVSKSVNKFYVRIPKNKVKEEVQRLTISVTGNFNTLTGNYYGTTGTDDSGNAWQRVISVTGNTTSISNGTTLEVAAAPDTGMNKVQTIYFIGLIVLLCGVGIIYANAKPVEIKQ